MGGGLPETPSEELLFIVEPAEEGGYTARAVGVSIFTKADTEEELRERVRDAVRCHFDDGEGPRAIRLPTTRHCGSARCRRYGMAWRSITE